MMGMSPEMQLRKALNAFDELYAATCGVAEHEAIARHFGSKTAERIMSAKARRDALPGLPKSIPALAASQPGTERSGADQNILPQTEKGS